MFASDCRKPVEVGDVQVTIRKLSARVLERAREARSAAQVKSLRDLGPEMVKVMKSDGLEAVAQELKRDESAVKRQRYGAFDRQTVLAEGIVSWTHSRPLDSAAIADLDEETAELLHEQILELSLPPLDRAESEAVEAKG